MKIGIDFDNVLFDTEAFKQFLEQEIEDFGRTYPGEGIYDPEEHAERLGVEPERIEEAIEEAGKFVYDDIEALEELDGHELVLVSRGDQEFQSSKIESSGVEEYFDRVVIVQDESKDTANIDVLVDDYQHEHERTGVPGMLFDREKHSIQDIIDWVREIET